MNADEKARAIILTVVLLTLLDIAQRPGAAVCRAASVVLGAKSRQRPMLLSCLLAVRCVLWSES